MTKKNLIIAAFIIAIAILSIIYNFLSILWGLVIFACIVFLLLVSIVKLFYRKLRSGWFSIPFTIIIICFIGIAVNCIKPLIPATPTSKLSVSDELAYLKATDVEDRQTLKASFSSLFGKGKNTLRYRDSLRCFSAKQLVADSLVKTPQDKYNAAYVFLHGHTVDYYQLAYKLASDAMLHNIPNAEWLSHAAWDKWQLRIGKPQKYGTQPTK